MTWTWDADRQEFVGHDPANTMTPQDMAMWASTLVLMREQARETHDLDWADCVGEGWREIVESLVALCFQTDTHISDVKEKFGGLRFYVGSAPAWVWNLIHYAEAYSYHICEICGDRGELRDDRSWIKTLCDEHAQ